MEVYFTDRKFNLEGVASTTLPKTIRLRNDKETEEIEAGVSLFEGDLVIPEKRVREVSRYVTEGNYFIFRNEETGEDEYYTITSYVKDRRRGIITFYAEDAGLDLLNEVVGEYEADKDYPASFYIEKFAHDSGFEIGINEISNLSRKLKWEGEATVTKRINSVATQFDHAEIKYRFEVHNLNVVRKFIDIYKKRGEDLNIDLRLNHEVDNIITTKSIENLATALRATGGTPEGKEEPITLQGYKYDDGRYYVDKQGVLRDRVSTEKWSRHVETNIIEKKALTKAFSYETTSKKELFNRTLAALKIVSEVEVNFEVDIIKLPDNVKIGDRINIVDEEDGLYLNTRILKMEHSRSENYRIATLGEFLIKESDLDPALLELAEKIANIPKGDTWYPWTRYADDDKGTNMSLFPQGKAYRAVKYVVNKAIASDDPKEYEGLWEKIQGPVGDPGKPGKPGENGKASVFHTAWANDLNGKDFTIYKNQAPGKGYFGTYSSYSTIQSTNYQDYAWVELAGAFEQAIKNLEKAINNVKEITRSITSPINPKKGDQWWQLNANGNNQVVAFNEWNGSSWVPSTIAQAVLNIVELNAVEINGSVITGSSFLNYWDRVLTNGRKGVTKIESGQIRIDYTVNSGALGYINLDDTGLTAELRKSDGTVVSAFTLNENYLAMFGEKPLNPGKSQSAQYKRDGISMTDETMPYGTVNLTYQDLMKLTPSRLIAAADWAVYATSGGSEPISFREGRLVTLSGAFKPLKVLPCNGITQRYLMAILPVGLRPLKDKPSVQLGSGVERFRLIVQTDGQVIADRNIGLNGYTDFRLGGWYTINDSFSAADI